MNVVRSGLTTLIDTRSDGRATGKLVKKERIHDAEYGRRSTHTEPDRQHGDRRERPIAAERSQRQANVAKQIVNPPQCPSVAIGFLICSTPPKSRRAAKRASIGFIPRRS
jgi:hypothetical protein